MQYKATRALKISATCSIPSNSTFQIFVHISACSMNSSKK